MSESCDIGTNRFFRSYSPAGLRVNQGEQSRLSAVQPAGIDVNAIRGFGESREAEGIGEPAVDTKQQGESEGLISDVHPTLSPPSLESGEPPADRVKQIWPW
jgi:hypothetical protein